MDITVLTLFPDMFQALGFGVTGRAVERDLVKLTYYNPRDYSMNRHHNVDDRPYGGGPGMVMSAQPLQLALQAATADIAKPATVIYLSPQGKRFDQACAQRLANQRNIVLIAGRYEGIDERFIAQHVTEEWSIGDYVLSGGELAAMVLIDAVTRLLPGVLGHEESAKQDSFATGLLDHPHYTRPEEFEGQVVPQVLLSGNHQEIQKWRLQQALGRTWLRRPDLLANRELNSKEQELLAEFIENEPN